MNRTRAAFYSFLWVGGGVVAANVFGYLLRILLARNLTVEEYGLVYAIMAVFGLLSVFAHWGLAEALTREVALARAVASARLKEVVLWVAFVLYASAAIILALAMWFAPLLAEHYFHSSSAAIPFTVYTISFLLSSIVYIIPSLLMGAHRSNLYTLFIVTQSGLLLLGAWLLLAYGVTGVMLAYVITMVTLHILFIPLLGRVLPGFWRARAHLRVKTAKRLFAYGIPVMLTGVAWVILSASDTALLTYFSSLAEVGRYQVALPTANLLLFLTPVIVTVLLPLLTHVWQDRKRALLSRSIQDLHAYVFLCIIPIAVAVATYPDILLNLLFGAQYVSAAPILRLLVVSALFITLNSVTAAAFSAIGKPKESTRAVAVGAVANLILNILLIPRLGGVGAAIATVCSAILIFSLGLRALRRHLAVRLPWRRWCGGLAAGFVFAAVLALMRSFPYLGQYPKIALAVLLGGLSYALVLFATRTVSMAELRDLWQRIAGRS